MLAGMLNVNQAQDTGTQFNNVTVTDSIFRNNAIKGLYIEKLSDSVFTNVQILNNGRYAPPTTLASTTLASFHAGGMDLNLKDGSYSNLTFNNLTVTGNGIGTKEGAGIMIKARGTGSDTGYSTYPATLTGVNITGGTFTDNERGIRFGEPTKNNTGPTNVAISGATIRDNIKQYTGIDGSTYGDVVNTSTVLVDAASNWWGTSVKSTIQANATGSVDFTPYYTDSGLTTFSDVKQLLNFTVPNQVGSSTIDEINHTINISVLAGTDVKVLVPTITINGSSISPISGTSTNFTSPVTYTVSSYDEETTQNYIVTVTTPIKKSGIRNTSSNITYVAGDNGKIEGVLEQRIASGRTGSEVVAIPDSGHTFVNWSDGLTTPSRSDLSPDVDITITAYFSNDVGQEVGGEIEPVTVETPTTPTPTGGEGEVSVPGSVSVVSDVFLRNLELGDEGEDVKLLQKFLNDNHFTVARGGAGAPGEETTYFGKRTQNALVRFQDVHADVILVPLGLKKGTGYFGTSTRDYVNSLLKK